MIWILWIALSVLIGVLAGQRGREGVAWLLLALVISPLIAGVILLIVGPYKPALEAQQLAARGDAQVPGVRRARARGRDQVQALWFRPSDPDGITAHHAPTFRICTRWICPEIRAMFSAASMYRRCRAASSSSGVVGLIS